MTTYAAESILTDDILIVIVLSGMSLGAFGFVMFILSITKIALHKQDSKK